MTSAAAAGTGAGTDKPGVDDDGRIRLHQFGWLQTSEKVVAADAAGDEAAVAVAAAAAAAAARSVGVSMKGGMREWLQTELGQEGTLAGETAVSRVDGRLGSWVNEDAH